MAKVISSQKIWPAHHWNSNWGSPPLEPCSASVPVVWASPCPAAAVSAPWAAVEMS